MSLYDRALNVYFLSQASTASRLPNSLAGDIMSGSSSSGTVPNGIILVKNDGNCKLVQVI